VVRDEDGTWQWATPGIWKWLAQCMGNCFVGESNEAELWAMFALGDYSDRGRPQPVPYRFDMEFSEKEKARNWSMVVTTARQQKWL
jgi:hypothetical protein